MKTRNIIALLVIAAFIVVLLISFGSNVSIYTDFTSAKTKTEDVHIVATWVKRTEAGYDAQHDLFTFYLKDTLGNIEQVRYYDPKPANLETADKIVVIGKYEQGRFVAHDILMKCPSKYQDNNIDPKTTPAYYRDTTQTNTARG